MLASRRTSAPKDCCGLQAVVELRSTGPETCERSNTMRQNGTRTWWDEERCKTEGPFRFGGSMGVITSRRIGAPRNCCGLQTAAGPRSTEPDASEYFHMTGRTGIHPGGGCRRGGGVCGGYLGPEAVLIRSKKLGLRLTARTLRSVEVHRNHFTTIRGKRQEARGKGQEARGMGLVA